MQIEDPFDIDPAFVYIVMLLFSFSSPTYSVSRGSWMDFFRPVAWEFRVPALPAPGAHDTRVAFVCS
jgi:hypothetical protein